MVLAVFYAVFRRFWPLYDTIVAFHVQYTVFSWKNAFSLYWNLSRLWKKSGDNFHKYKKKNSSLKLTQKIWLSQKRDKAESRICWPHWCWSTWLYTLKYRNFKAIEKTEKKIMHWVLEYTIWEKYDKAAVTHWRNCHTYMDIFFSAFFAQI